MKNNNKLQIIIIYIIIYIYIVNVKINYVYSTPSLSDNMIMSCCCVIYIYYDFTCKYYKSTRPHVRLMSLFHLKTFEDEILSLWGGKYYRNV